MPIASTSARRTVLLAAAAALLGLTTQMANAALIRVDFQSRVDGSQLLPILGIAPSLGDAVVGHFVYDTEALDQDPGDPTLGVYTSGSIQIEIGGLTLTSAAPATQLTSDKATNDFWVIAAGSTLSDDDGVLVDGVFTPRVRMVLIFRQPMGAFTSDAPPTLAEMGLLDPVQFYVAQDDPDALAERIVFFDDVTRLQAAVVPVPATLPLALAGLGLAGLSARRRHPTTPQERT